VKRASPADLEARYPALSYVLGAYFHQDWDLGGPTWEAVVSAFTASNDSAAVAGAAVDIARLLADVPGEEALTDALNALGCAYDPRPDLPDGSSPRAWLERVREHLLAASRPAV
jgi:hypothetical protein